MKKHFQFALLCIVIMSPLTACSGTLTVEPDAYDPNLHGREVHFTVPVVYVELSDKDKNEFDEKTFETGRLLVRKRIGHSLLEGNKKRILLKLPQKMSFTIMESFWVRQDWFTREFAPDYNKVVLKDENGFFSVTLRSLLVDTDMPELGKNER